MENSSKSGTQRHTVLDREDADMFSRILRDTYPNVRFLAYDYWENKRDDGRGYQEPPDLVVPYFDSLGAKEERFYRVWLEPEGWTPVWTGPNKKGLHFIANEPRLQFEFQRSDAAWPDYKKIRDGRVSANYERDDKEHKAFLRKVWRLIEKMTTRELVLMVEKTVETMGPWQPDPDNPLGMILPMKVTETRIENPVPRITGYYIGPHVVEWCLAASDRTIGDHERPPEPDGGAEALKHMPRLRTTDESIRAMKADKARRKR